MMGRAHATSGAAVWLAGCAAAQAFGGHPDLAVYTVGTAVCAGWALAPDLDHPSSTLARSAGPVSQLLAAGLGRFGAWVHWRTRTEHDRVDLDGHRTITHTLAWALLWGAVVAVVQRWAGPLTAALLVFASANVGVHALLPPSQRRFRTGIPVGVAAGLVLGAVAYTLTPGGGWWLGLAAGVGSLVHCLGDAVTDSGCPILWPVRIGRAQPRRWYPVGPPQRMRFAAGGPTESLIVQPLLLLVAAAAVVAALWPVLSRG